MYLSGRGRCRAVGVASNEEGNRFGCIDWAVAVGPAEWTGLTTDFLCADDGSIGLSTAKGRSTIAGSPIDN